MAGRRNISFLLIYSFKNRKEDKENGNERGEKRRTGKERWQNPKYLKQVELYVTSSTPPKAAKGDNKDNRRDDEEEKRDDEWSSVGCREDEKGGQREQGGMCRKHWRQLERATLLMVRSYSSKSLQGGEGEEGEERESEPMFGSRCVPLTPDLRSDSAATTDTWDQTNCALTADSESAQMAQQHHTVLFNVSFHLMHFKSVLFKLTLFSGWKM